MKQLFVLILVAFSLKALSQSKPSWELIVNISGISNSSPQDKPWQPMPGSGGTAYLLDSSGNRVSLPPNIYSAYQQTTNTVQYKSKLTAGISFGGRLNYPLNKNFDVSIGGTISFMNLTRTSGNSFANSFYLATGLTPRDSLFGTTGTGTPVFIGTSSSYLSALNNQVETFSFTNFNVPVSLCYKKAKWRFEAGIVPSFIISSSKKKTTQPSDPEISFTETQTPFENNQKTTVGLSICPNYQITKSIGLGIEYVHGLTTLIDADNTRRLLSRNINLKSLYKL